MRTVRDMDSGPGGAVGRRGQWATGDSGPRPYRPMILKPFEVSHTPEALGNFLLFLLLSGFIRYIIHV